MKYVFIFLLIVFPWFCSCEEKELKFCFELIEKDDFFEIDGLFKYLIFDESFAFALFGNKPISTIAVYKPSRAVDTIIFGNCLNYSLDLLWNTWKKYKLLFPMTQYVFFSQERDGYFEIYLINKKNCLKVIKENLTLFQKEIGAEKNPQEILDSLCFTKDIFSEALNNSQILYGILFGYGKESAQGFYDVHFHPHRYILKQPHRIEHDWLTTHFCALEIPRFASFSEKEGAYLIKEYDLQRRKILDEYSKGDFLEITLSKLCEK